MKTIFSRMLHKIQRKLRHDKRYERYERGQVLVIVTLSVIGLVAAVGLTVDVGLLYLNHGKLRRAVDAAALAATAQFREGYDTDKMSAAAKEFLDLNGINDPSAIVETSRDNCITQADYDNDPVLCTDPKRKLVRVQATSVIKLAFLPVIGIHEATISAMAVSEAASMDVVLVIDTSESMAYGAPEDRNDPEHYLRDPSQCNPVHACEPFEEVKAAAQAFVDQLYFPFDRVAIVTFDSGGRVDLPFNDNRAEVKNAITDLNVFSPGDCLEGNYPGWGLCREYERYPDCDGNPPAAWANGNCDGDIRNEAYIDENGDGIGDTFLFFDCPVWHTTGNAETCGSTSIGRGLHFAGAEFGNPDTFREEALWVVILLTDGAANGPSYTCPHGTWDGAPFCRDLQLSRHCAEADDNYCLDAGGILDELDYDADDYARDRADFIGKDQNALIFSIGLGNLVKSSVPRARLDADGNPTSEKCDTGEPIADCMGAGEQLLRYAAEEVGGGTYYFAPSGNQLEEIFLDIARNLATRLTR